MNITKRDIADIVLVVMAISFSLELFKCMSSLAYFACKPNGDFESPSSFTPFIAEILILMVVNYLLLFKRRLVLAIVFPDEKDKELVVPEGLIPLTSFSFWIKFFGVFFFLKSFLSFASKLISDLLIHARFPVGSFAWINCTYSLVSLILTSIIIWKSDWIGTKLESIKSSNQSSEPT